MTYAYAICSTDDIDLKHVSTTVHFSEVSGPNTASTGQTATAGCSREDGQLVSGGAAISGGNVTTTDFSKATSGGPHLNGSFPSDAAGTPVGDGAPTRRTGRQPPTAGFALPEQLLRRLGAVPGRAARAQAVAPRATSPQRTLRRQEGPLAAVSGHPTRPL